MCQQNLNILKPRDGVQSSVFCIVSETLSQIIFGRVVMKLEFRKPSLLPIHTKTIDMFLSQ